MKRIPESMDGDVYLDLLSETPEEEVDILKRTVLSIDVLKELKAGNFSSVDYLPLELIVQLLACELYKNIS